MAQMRDRFSARRARWCGTLRLRDDLELRQRPLRRADPRVGKPDEQGGLTERDICTKFITPAVKQAGWDEMSQVREEVSFTKGRIIVRGKLVTRGNR